MWVFEFLTIAAHGGCEDRLVLVEQLERQVLEGRFDEAEGTKRSLVAAFGCGSLAEPVLLARLWLAEAVVLAARADPSATVAFAGAAGLSPQTWIESYGPALRKQWEEARLLSPARPGTVYIDPLYPGYIAAIDGSVMPFPATTTAGPHLLQVGSSVTEMTTAIRFDLPPGIDLSLDPRLPVLPIVPPLEPGRDVRGRRVFHALLVGGAGALIYSASFATHAAFQAAPPAERSAELRAVNDGLVIGAGLTGGVSAILLVRGIASPTRNPPDPGP